MFLAARSLVSITDWFLEVKIEGECHSLKSEVSKRLTVNIVSLDTKSTNHQPYFRFHKLQEKVLFVSSSSYLFLLNPLETSGFLMVP